MNRRRRLIGWLAAAVAAAALVVCGRLFHLGGLLQDLQRWFASLGFAGALLFAAFYVGCSLLLLPATVLTIAAGAIFGLLWGGLLSAAAAIATAALAFLIARHFARDRVERAVRARPRLRAVDRAIGEGGFRVVVLLRLSPVVPFSVSNYVYGVTAVRFPPYLVASALGMLPGTFLYTYLGVLGGTAAGGNASVWHWMLLVAGVLATGAATFLVARRARVALHSRPRRRGPRPRHPRRRRRVRSTRVRARQH